MSRYLKLLERARKTVLLETVVGIVHWDMETMMPPRGITLRSEQLGLLSRMAHKITTDPEIGQLINQLQSSSDYDRLSSAQKRNVHLIKKQYDEQTKLPEELVVETAKQQAITVDTWKKAKTVRSYSDFKPALEKLVNLRKEAASILMEVKRTATPYDALIDIFEPKMTAQTISRVFRELRTGLMRIIDRYGSHPREVDVSILERRIPIRIQREISNALAEITGYDIHSKKAGGRVDQTEHPFTTGYYPDVRITTHYYEDKWSSSVFSVMHEIGHAVYAQSLPSDWIYQPIGDSCSLGFHESQSRFFENIIGRSREFWIYFLPRLKKITGQTLIDVDLDTMVRAINHIVPSKIRIEADEVTYCLHIIIRFEIEQELFSNKITVSELPQAWNEKYEQYLGVEVENDTEGVMQDTHWASGNFGYFPTYALGNIYSGQILEKLEIDLRNWQQGVSRGDCREVKSWLIDNIYKYGNLLDPPDLIKKIAGKEITVEPYLSYLDRKCSQIYE